MGKDPATVSTSMCLGKARGATAGVKRRVRCEGEWRPVKQSPADKRKEYGFNFNAGEAAGRGHRV